MLEALFGNKNIERILIFLFVNGKGYGTQLHRVLGVPLTPLQKALQRLEKGSIIESYLEGKTRVYQLSPHFPLKDELEQLIKKAFTVLPTQEKKEYYLIRETLWAHPQTQKVKLQTLHDFWIKLPSIKELTVTALSRTRDDGWNGKGLGEVKVIKESQTVITFIETGSWLTPYGSGEVSFTNSFRWTIDRDRCLISLEHLRRGPNNPVLIFHLAPSSKNTLASIDSHLPMADTYFGQISFDSYGIHMNWRAIGATKNEEISYFYS